MKNDTEELVDFLLEKHKAELDSMDEARGHAGPGGLYPHQTGETYDQLMDRAFDRTTECIRLRDLVYLLYQRKGG